jgi:hypothetical protein
VGSKDQLARLYTGGGGGLRFYVGLLIPFFCAFRAQFNDRGNQLWFAFVAICPTPRPTGSFRLPRALGELRRLRRVIREEHVRFALCHKLFVALLPAQRNSAASQLAVGDIKTDFAFHRQVYSPTN